MFHPKIFCVFKLKKELAQISSYYREKHFISSVDACTNKYTIISCRYSLPFHIFNLNIQTDIQHSTHSKKKTDKLFEKKIVCYTDGDQTNVR